eukprot:7300187-Ditylum_brightwellii.AAC.1
MRIKTCVKEASRSAKLSGCSIYGMSSCHIEYRSGYVEQFAEMHASGLDPARDLGVTWVKGRNGRVNPNGAYNNQYVLLPIWRRRRLNTWCLSLRKIV